VTGRGPLNNVLFIFVALVFMYIGRFLGWSFSKRILYPYPAVLSLVGVVIWGAGVGWSMSSLIAWQHPNVIVKWVFGFALAAYVAIPNFGLFHESTIPDRVQIRHAMISTVPLIAYIVTEFATRSMRA